MQVSHLFVTLLSAQQSLWEGFGDGGALTQAFMHGNKALFVFFPSAFVLKSAVTFTCMHMLLMNRRINNPGILSSSAGQRHNVWSAIDALTPRLSTSPSPDDSGSVGNKSDPDLFPTDPGQIRSNHR